MPAAQGPTTSPVAALRSHPTHAHRAVLHFDPRRKPRCLKTPLIQRLLTPTDKRGFVTSKFWAVVRMHPGHALKPRAGFMDWMARVVTPGARLNPCFQHPVHQYCLKTVLVVSVSFRSMKP